MKVKMKDVARRAGVSIATVSYVINGTRNVKEETRKKVEQAIDELNYSPDVSAQKLKSGQNRLIGLITPSCAGTFTSEIIDACESRLSEDGYQLLILNTSFKPESERNALHILSSGIVDGIILISLCDSSHKIQKELPLNFPCVIANCSYPDSPVDSVGFTTYRTMQDAVRYFKERGHDKIGIFTGPSYLSSAQEQKSSFQHALKINQMNFDSAYYLPTSKAEHNIRQVTKQMTDKGCRAFLFSNFNMLLDTFQDTDTGSFAIPSDFDVITFCEARNDQNYFKWVSKVLCPTHELGKLACERLLSRLRGDLGPVQRILLDCEFEANDSV